MLLRFTALKSHLLSHATQHMPDQASSPPAPLQNPREGRRVLVGPELLAQFHWVLEYGWLEFSEQGRRKKQSISTSPGGRIPVDPNEKRQKTKYINLYRICTAMQILLIGSTVRMAAWVVAITHGRDDYRKRAAITAVLSGSGAVDANTF